ncbi:MAG: UvrD-helicase domain-containing protein, partial [Anaerolineales bacterium]
MEFTPRPSQREILKYTGGTLGISAVPGSGKTHTLSALAAQIISSGQLERDQEVLIVTLVNSAVDNFSARIGEFIQARGLIPQLGYRVRTLHGLAHDIVRENPPLVGLDKKFSIVDETASSSMIADAARAWVQTHPDFLDQYISTALDDYQTRRVRDKDWPQLIETLAASFIRSAKDRRLAPDKLRLALDRQPAPLSLAHMG